jgi:hypothetical protein
MSTQSANDSISGHDDTDYENLFKEVLTKMEEKVTEVMDPRAAKILSREYKTALLAQTEKLLVDTKAKSRELDMLSFKRSYKKANLLYEDFEMFPAHLKFHMEKTIGEDHLRDTGSASSSASSTPHQKESRSLVVGDTSEPTTSPEGNDPSAKSDEDTMEEDHEPALKKQKQTDPTITKLQKRRYLETKTNIGAEKREACTEQLKGMYDTMKEDQIIDYKSAKEGLKITSEYCVFANCGIQMLEEYLREKARTAPTSDPIHEIHRLAEGMRSDSSLFLNNLRLLMEQKYFHWQVVKSVNATRNARCSEYDIKMDSESRKLFDTNQKAFQTKNQATNHFYNRNKTKNSYQRNKVQGGNSTTNRNNHGILGRLGPIDKRKGPSGGNGAAA